MDWQLNELRKAEYDQMIKSAQDLEATIGSSQYRIQKLLNMRSELDTTLKTWWEELIKEMNLPDKRDFMITREGLIKDVTKEAPAVKPVETKVGTSVTEL